jgi:hypothetical protein
MLRSSIPLLLTKYFSGSQIEKTEMGGHTARMGKNRSAYRVLVGKPEAESQHARPRRRWEDNVTMDVQAVEFGGRDWIGLVQDRDRCQVLESMAVNFRVT